MAKVSKFSTKSSGQGVSRKSYQMGRELGNRGVAASAGGVGGVTVPKSANSEIRGGGIASGTTSYPKAGAVSSEYGPDVAYPNNLAALSSISKMGKPPKAPKGFT